MATAFPQNWNIQKTPAAKWTDDGYVVDPATAANGSSMVNDLMLEMGRALERVNTKINQR